jgi:phosphopantothenoylcysteine decarboxylase/phosphopantothenate--cysteine ligase
LDVKYYQGFFLGKQEDMPNPLTNKHILLGVTGSIACYKAAELASKLNQAGAKVSTILTEAGERFITPLTFQSVTGQRAFTDADLWGREGHIHHISLGQNGDLMIIAPASANTLAKLANGIADNLLTVTALAARCPLLVAPAMDAGMYNHPATQENLEKLRNRGVFIIGPGEGHLASGLSGLGRMVEPLELLGHIRRTLASDGVLKNQLVIVTTGGTMEPIDPVRTIANRSSGKQGVALAQSALDRGAEVTLICASTHLLTPVGATRIDVGSAEDMLTAVLEVTPQADALIMAAAVADFQVVQPANTKIKKERGIPAIELELAPDILEAVSQIKSRIGKPQVVVGFAAESQDLVANAQKKLASKKLDIIVANDISSSDAGFAVDSNRVTILEPNGVCEHLPLLSKDEVAEIVMERVTRKLRNLDVEST